MTKDEALKLALEALEDIANETYDSWTNGAKAQRIAQNLIPVIKEALAQPEQHQDWCASLTRMLTSMPPKPAPCNCKPKPEKETVALQAVYETIIHWDEGGGKRSRRELARQIVSLYTTPPQRKPLTDERSHQILLDMAKHIETFGDESTTEQALSAECIRFILERVSAHGIKGEA